jgi:hypothetical protein
MKRRPDMVDGITPSAKLAARSLIDILKEIWWRRRELNPDPKAAAAGVYMLSRFSSKFRPRQSK